MVKNLPANAGDLGSIPGLVRCPREGNGNPLQYSCPWEMPWSEEPGGYSPWVLKSRTRLCILMTTTRSPFMRLHPHDLIPSKAPLPNTIILEVRV